MNRLIFSVCLLIFQFDLTRSECERFVDEINSRVKCYYPSLKQINAVQNADTVTTLNIVNGDETFAHLSKNAFNYTTLSSLTIKNSNIETMRPGTFDNMRSLIYLDLSENKLRSLPAKMFENNGQLRVLNISYNEISTILKDSFAGMTDLIELQLVSNNLRIIKNIFTSLTQLEILNLSWNLIQNIEPQTFKENVNLKKIRLNFNAITDLKENTFLPHEWEVTNVFLTSSFDSNNANQFDMYKSAPILELRITDCGLTNIKNYYFVHLRHLITLDLHSNRITNIESNAFHENIFLQSLFLSHNKIKVLPSNIFRSLRNLKYLWLRANELSTLPIDIFKSNKKLVELHLAGNQIKELNPNVFQYLKKLEKLELFTNYLTSVPKNIFDHLIELKELNLFRNHITYIEPGAFDSLKHLKVLILDHNNLTTLSSNIFFNLTELNVLKLGSTGLTDIEYGTFNSYHEGYADDTSRILELSLEVNNLTHLSYSAFAPLTRLISLNVGHNSIATIDENFFQLMSKTLRILIMSANHFETFPDGVFDSLENVGFLDLSRNRLKDLYAEIFQSMISLEKLDLSGNQFKSIPVDLLNVPRLREVNFADNRLIYLASNIFEGDDCIVERFDIQANRLTFLESDFLQRSKLKYLQFGKNPWQCGCLNDIMNDIYRLNIEYSKYDYFDGKNPLCVATQNNSCVHETYLADDLYNQYHSVQHSSPTWLYIP